MNKKTSILLLAWVCLAGIAVLAIAQPVSVVTSTNGTASNQTVNITSHYPVELEINDTEGASRTFNITINQPVNVSWLINGTEVLNESGVNFSEYNASAVPGYWNVTAYAYNENGSDMRTWWWTVNATANDTSSPTVKKIPFVISGYAAYANPAVNITNLNTNESFTVETYANESYYRLLTDSTHVHEGDVIRINMSDGKNYTVTDYTITAEDIENGGLQAADFTVTDLLLNPREPAIGDIVNITAKIANSGDASGTPCIEFYDRKEDMNIEREMKEGDQGLTVITVKGAEKIRVHFDHIDAKNITMRDKNNSTVWVPLSAKNIWTNWFEGDTILANKTYEDAICKVKIDKYEVVFANKSITLDAGKHTNITASWNLPDMLAQYAAGNHILKVCIDPDNKIAESNETNNNRSEQIRVRAPDLKLVNYSEEWIDRANRTFNIRYTVKNIGDANASNSTTYAHDETTDYTVYDQVPALEPGKSYNSTLGPFRILPDRYRTKVKICADYNHTVRESREDNNWIEDKFGLPKLKFWGGAFGGVDFTLNWENKTYNISYSILNDCNTLFPNAGWGRSNTSEVHIYIDGVLRENGTVPPLEPYYTGNAHDFVYTNTSGPFSMTGENDTVRICIKWFDGYEEECSDLVIGPGCVGNQTVFYCGQPITESCRLVTDMYATKPEFSKDPSYPNGLLIGADDITIDGNGFAIIGDSCIARSKDSFGEWVRWAGISNSGHKNVTIKNLEVRDFCNGISIKNADNNIIENCSVHDNGAEDMYTYGITVTSSDRVTINNCSIYNNTGILTDENVCGGHGINFDEGSDYCEVTNSSIFHNYLSGILASPTCKYLYIGNNTIEENGQCGESGFCAGVNLHWKGGFGITTNSTVENNVIVNNTGSGIYVAQGYTTIKNNTVRGSKKNDSDLNVNGYGILIDGGRVTFLHNNTCCENEGADIVNQGFATFGDDNTCDVTDNYNDEGTRGCNFYCGGENGACIGDATGTVFRCGDVVTESCTFNRSMSCRGCSGYGLIAGADNITIDGAGYALTGNFAGIGIFSNRSRVKIKNLQVEDFSTGMEIENTSGVLIENCTVRTNLLTGINFSADNGTVRNSRIYDNFGPGIFVGGANNVFANNTVAKNRNGTLPGYGIYFSPDAKGNSLTTNFIGDNEYYDIYNEDGASNYNLSDNNTCDIAFNYWDASMLKDKKYNCTYAWTPPDLIISNKYEEWVDEKNATYSVTYTIENIGAPKSRPAERSTTYLFIWGAHAANDEVGPLKPGENYTSTFGYTPTIPEKLDKDRIKVCADGANEVEENNPANIFYYKDNEWYSVGDLFEDKEANNCYENTFSKSGPDIPEWNVSAACVASDGTEYRCGDIVEKSCKFNDNMSCPSGHGLIIGADYITIDGAGFAIGRDAPASSCAGVSETNPRGGDCGIYNPGYDHVTITNLEILHFCNGIGLDGSSDVVVGNIIENCKIHDNGNSAGYSHGIHMVRVKDTTIRNNDIHHNRGTGTSCGGGGNGIFLYAGNIPNANNTIVDNDLHENDRAGFWTKMGMNGCTIKNNRIWGNSIGSGLGDMTGGLVLQCVESDNNTIEGNEVWANHGRGGIFIGGDYNIIRNNNVSDNKGDGINIGRCDGGSTSNQLYDNTVCNNGGVDIRTCGEEYGNYGDENTCDTTENYNDTGTTNCTYPCSGIALPDLVITEICGDWDSEEDRTYNVTYTVKNIGTADASESTTNLQILEGDSHTDEVPVLKPGDSHTHTFGPFTLPPSRTSDKITVIADMGNAVTESNETNNEKVYYFPPVLTSIVVSPSTARLKVGETQVFTATAYDQNGDPMQGITITWSSSDERVGTISPAIVTTNEEGKATTVFTANHVGTTTITAESGGISGYAKVTVWFEEPEEPEVPSFVRPGGGGRPPAGEENITGYEPGPGEGGGGSVGEGKEAPINETNKSVSGGKTKKKSGYRIGPKGLEILVENVKVMAPVFLIVMVVIFVALFYSGYFGEKRAHRRKNKRGTDKTQK